MAKLVTQEDVDRFYAELKGRFSQKKWDDFVATLPEIDPIPRTFTNATREELVDLLGEEEILLAEAEATRIGVAIPFGLTVPTDYVIVRSIA